MAGNQGGAPSRPRPQTAEQRADENSGLISSLFSGIASLITTLFFSCIANVAVALIGVVWWWPEEGSNHERSTLIAEMGELAESLTRYGGTVANFAGDAVMGAMDWWWGPGMVKAGVEWISSWISPNAVVLGETAYFAMQIFIVRCGVIISSIPLIALAFVGGVFYGLVERDLRRFNAARESSTVFNLATEHLSVPFLFGVALYLAWPLRAYSLVAMAPVYFGTFFVSFVAVSRYKKNL